jgi:hypothetical protein
MSSYLVYDAQTSQPLFIQLSNSAPALSAEYAFIPVDEGTVIGRGDTVANGVLVRYAPTLDDAKAAKRTLADATMQARIAAGFTWSGKLYQIDIDSQTRIAPMECRFLLGRRRQQPCGYGCGGDLCLCARRGSVCQRLHPASAHDQRWDRRRSRSGRVGRHRCDGGVSGGQRVNCIILNAQAAAFWRLFLCPQSRSIQ